MGWKPWIDSKRQREAIGKRRNRTQTLEGITEWGQKRGRLVSYRSNYSGKNAVLPVRGSARPTGYDLCAASNYVIPSRGKGIVDTGLAVSLPLGT